MPGNGSEQLRADHREDRRGGRQRVRYRAGAREDGGRVGADRVRGAALQGDRHVHHQDLRGDLADDRRTLANNMILMSAQRLLQIVYL